MLEELFQRKYHSQVLPVQIIPTTTLLTKTTKWTISSFCFLERHELLGLERQDKDERHQIIIESCVKSKANHTINQLLIAHLNQE
jgi:hypothetical protein